MLSTTGSDSGFGDTTSLLNSIDTSLLSPDTATALLDLNVSMEQDWMQKIVDSLSSANSASTNNEEETDPMQAYYQAMVAMTEAQKNMLLG